VTAQNVSKMNQAWLHADKLCAVIDRAYSGTESTQEFPYLIFRSPCRRPQPLDLNSFIPFITTHSIKAEK